MIATFTIVGENVEENMTLLFTLIYMKLVNILTRNSDSVDECTYTRARTHIKH